MKILFLKDNDVINSGRVVGVYPTAFLNFSCLEDTFDKLFPESDGILFGSASWLRLGKNAGSHGGGRSIDLSRILDRSGNGLLYFDQTTVKESNNPKLCTILAKFSNFELVENPVNYWNKLCIALQFLFSRNVLSQAIGKNFIMDKGWTADPWLTTDKIETILSNSNCSRTTDKKMNTYKRLIARHQDHIHITFHRWNNFHVLQSVKLELLERSQDQLLHEIRDSIPPQFIQFKEDSK